jgi:hypothetical protein
MTGRQSENTTILENREAMMNQRPLVCIRSGIMLQRAMYVLALCAILFAYGCGSDSHQTGTSEKYPAGISEDIAQQLKYDARVDSFDPEGEDLVVHVNDAWLQSPPGIRERALGQWYSLWRPSHSAASNVVVKFEGNEVERWSSEKGYQPAAKEAKEPSEG